MPRLIRLLSFNSYEAVGLAGFLLLLQGVANLLREIGLVEKKP